MQDVRTRLPNAKDIMHINAILIQPDMHINSDEGKIEIDITNTHNELNDWVERIGKTANEICDDSAGTGTVISRIDSI